MSRETPVISVVMPVYNGERFLREAIDSILNQTYKDFEFIIIDDGSTDQTSAILDTYQDPRIVRLTHP
ncbi:MAG: glycosyltransferase, partial [Bacteroidales bacterium]|nr:glycosyltransferase [Bacteroidales bacterium]